MYKKIQCNTNLDKLKEECLYLFSKEEFVSPIIGNQVGLTYADESSDNKFYDGVGSLDWDYSKWSLEDQNNNINPPRRKNQYRERDFDKIVPELKGMYIYDLLEELKEKFRIGRTRLMLMKPKTCLTLHRDSTFRFHIPIITNEGCLMVWENNTLHMPEGSCYWVDTTKPHTALNGSHKERIHLVATVEEKL